GSIVIGGEATFQSGGAITLANAGNSFGDVVNLTGGAARIETAGALRLGDLDVASLEATSHGALDLGQGSIAGDLVARSNGGAIGQSGALSVGGTSTLDADGGNITLADAGNDFTDAV